MPLVGSGNSFGGLAGSNAAARLLVVISGTSAPLEAAIAQANGSLAGFGKNATSIGNALTRSVTLPLAAIGGAAIALASNFESLIARIAGLTPLAGQLKGGIDEVRSSLLAIANDPKVVASPADLAESLYFAGSAGLDAADAFQVVKLSAQGASIGMGEAADISKLLIFALNNYPDGALTAASAMDVLTAAIREGTAAPDEMAVALGRLLPVAAKAGITFEQVVGSVAALTNLGVPTRVATTSLRALFSQLLAPTIQATELLDELGISAEELRAKLEIGPIAAFKLLEDATAGNVDQLHDLIPQIRAITAYYGLSGDKAQRYQEILDQVNNSQGFFAKALEEISKTPGFKFQKSLQELQVAGIELGTKLFPVFTGIADIISRVAEGFQDLGEGGKTAFAGILVLAAAAGPIFKLVGAITAVKEVTLATGAAGKTTVPTLKALSTGFLTAGIAAGIAFSGFKQIADGTADLPTKIAAVVAAIVTLKLVFSGIQAAANAGMLGVNSFSLAIVGLSGGTIAAAIGAITALGFAIAFVAGESKKLENFGKSFGSGLKAAGQGAQTYSDFLGGLENEGVADELRRIADAVGLLNQQINATNLGEYREGIGVDLARVLSELDQMDLADFSGPDELEKIPDLIRAGAAEGKDLNDILAGADSSVDELLDGLGNLSVSGEAADPAKFASELIFAYNEAGVARQELIDSTSATIQANAEEQRSLQALADKYGVSTSYMSDQLSNFGSTATGVLGENEDEFVDSALAAQGFSEDTTLAAAQAKSAIADMAASMSENLQGTAGLFDEFPEKIKKSAEQLTTHAEAMSGIAVKQTQDILTLARRGVPAGLLDQLIAGGPNMLDKFASASDSELKRLVTAYQVRLAAMDESILKEAQHQEVKGKNMVQGFALSILGNKNLPGSAANQVIKTVTDAFNKGDLTQEGLGLVTSFSHALSRAKGVSKAQAVKAVLAFAEGVASGKFVNKAGNIVVQDFAASLAKGTGISKQKALQLVRGAVDGINSKKGEAGKAGRAVANNAAHGLGSQKQAAFSQGQALGNQFASGITASTGAIQAAARAAAAAAKNAMDDGLKNSPEYFTYYMGKKLMTDMDRGMKDGQAYLHGYKPSVSMPVAKPAGDGGMRELARAIRETGRGDIVVRVDGREIARATERHHRKARA